MRACKNASCPEGLYTLQCRVRFMCAFGSVRVSDTFHPVCGCADPCRFLFMCACTGFVSTERVSDTNSPLSCPVIVCSTQCRAQFVRALAIFVLHKSVRSSASCPMRVSDIVSYPLRECPTHIHRCLVRCVCTLTSVVPSSCVRSSASRPLRECPSQSRGQ